MSHMVVLFEVYELTEDGYSVPKGSFGYIESEDDLYEGSAFVHWMAPQFGGSGPISKEHLKETGKPITIPYKTLRKLGWHKTETTKRPLGGNI